MHRKCIRRELKSGVFAVSCSRSEGGSDANHPGTVHGGAPGLVFPLGDDVGMDRQPAVCLLTGRGWVQGTSPCLMALGGDSGSAFSWVPCQGLKGRGAAELSWAGFKQNDSKAQGCRESRGHTSLPVPSSAGHTAPVQDHRGPCLGAARQLMWNFSFLPVFSGSYHPFGTC